MARRSKGPKRRRIELRAGPLDGRSAIEQPGHELTPNVVLRYVRDGIGPTPGETVPFSMCLYVAQRSGGVYEFAEAVDKTMTAEEYVELQGLLAMFDFLRHVAEDPRLLTGPEAACCDDTTLDLAEAERLRTTALRNFRAKAVKVQTALREKSDDWLWAYLRTRLKSDLEWLDMGSVRAIA